MSRRHAACPLPHGNRHGDPPDWHAGCQRVPEPLDPVVAADEKDGSSRAGPFECLGDPSLDVEVIFARLPASERLFESIRHEHA